MKTEYLYEFSVLAQTLSFSRAAQALFLSQSTLSKHIQRMEDELGAQLLVRSTHAVALTEAGRLLASQAERIIRQCSRVQRQLRRESSSMEGRLSVGCSTEISCASHIRMFFSAFLRQYPGIDLHLEILAKMPRDTLERYDIVLSPCSYFDLPEGSRAVLVRRHETYLVLPAGHPLMSHSTIGLHQLTGQTLIIPYADELFGPYARNGQLAARSCAQKLNSIPVPNLTTALMLVSLAQGVLIAPRYVHTLAPSDLYLVAISNPNCRFDEYLYAARPAENPAAELFIDEFLHSIPIESGK
ncbi:MAG: LysR family transcriptional regulator [Candidatus Ventricola sp.]